MLFYLSVLAIVLSLIFISYQLMRWDWTHILKFDTNRKDCIFFFLMSVAGFWFIIPWSIIRIALHKSNIGTKISNWLDEEVK